MRYFIRFVTAATMLASVPAAANCYYGSDCYARENDLRWQQTYDEMAAQTASREAEAAAVDSEQRLEKRIKALEDRSPY